MTADWRDQSLSRQHARPLDPRAALAHTAPATAAGMRHLSWGRVASTGRLSATGRRAHLPAASTTPPPRPAYLQVATTASCAAVKSWLSCPASSLWRFIEALSPARAAASMSRLLVIDSR
jgi:hypothetical protein